MSEHNIILPSKPKAILEEMFKGIYEIDGLYPGYGYTLANSLRRIILSSLEGSAVTAVKIEGVNHEFATMDGVKEDVITILLHLKNIRFNVAGSETQKVTLTVKGPKVVTAADIKATGQVEILNPDHYICELTGKGTLSMELTIEKGRGFVTREQHQKEKAEIGTIYLDAIFSPIRRVSYDVEDMRVGDKTNYNRIRVVIETDGTISPREALEQSVRTMIDQLAAIVNVDSGKVIDAIQAEMTAPVREAAFESPALDEKSEEGSSVDMTDVLKTRIDAIGLSTRTLNALSAANIRTVGGVARKHADDLLEIEGIGEKGIQEIKKALSVFSLSLRE